MLKFFRRIRQKFLEQGSTKKYVIYALGEVLLIVVGILLALQISSWSEQSKKRKEEISLLSQLQDALELEIADLEFNINSIRETINSISIIGDHLEKGLPYHDSLDFYFGNSSKAVGIVVKPGVYENLKFSGLGLISNDSLRNSIVTHYDYIFSYLVKIEETLVVPHHNLGVRPKMIEKFDFSWILQPAVPFNYEELLNDREYLSLLKTTKEIIIFQIDRTKEVLDSAKKLQFAIEMELNTIRT